eukprot:m.1471069 g.1471069  ORF g.1471069 m.1471069 type:complete len:77 (-) comp25144_c0_seq26:246-476(-)
MASKSRQTFKTVSPVCINVFWERLYRARGVTDASMHPYMHVRVNTSLQVMTEVYTRPGDRNLKYVGAPHYSWVLDG